MAKEKALYRTIPEDALRPQAAKDYRAMNAAEEKYKATKEYKAFVAAQEKAIATIAGDVATKEGCDASQIAVSFRWSKISWTEATRGRSTSYDFK